MAEVIIQKKKNLNSESSVLNAVVSDSGSWLTGLEPEAHPPQALLRRAFRDAFLLTTLVKSDDLTHRSLPVSSNQSDQSYIYSCRSTSLNVDLCLIVAFSYNHS